MDDQSVTLPQNLLLQLSLLSDSVAPGTPGRSYYSNLGFFMQTFSPPAGANAFELAQYRRLIALFENEGALKPGVRSRFEEALDRAIRERGVCNLGSQAFAFIDAGWLPR